MGDIQEAAKAIVRKLVSAGFIAYYAGGWVRDFVLKRRLSDIDIATSAPPGKIIELFPRTVAVGANFGVVVVMEKGHSFEVSSFRKDGLYIDGRHPETISYSTPEEDAQRRDFTINGMFYDPLKEQILDFVGGLEDLKKGVIRAIGEPTHRFQEDKLRMIRAVRLSARFVFPIEKSTENAILSHANSLFPAVAMERVWQEFKKMAEHPHFEQAIVTLHRLGLLQVIFPHIKEESLDAIKLRVTSFIHFPHGTPLILFLLELFPDLTFDNQLALCLYLKATNKDQQLIEKMDCARNLVKNKMTEDVEWARFYAWSESDLLLRVISARYDEKARVDFLKIHSQRRYKLLPSIQRIQQKNPLINSIILKEEGISPGKNMGILLKEAERIAINSSINDPHEIIRLLKMTSLWPKVNE